MIIIGVVADTHGLLRPDVLRAFERVELIVHAGDVGGRAVLDGLSRIARVEAVYGNVDDPHDPSLARERTISAGGLTLHVSHGHELGRPTPSLALARYAGDVVIFGHTHRAPHDCRRRGGGRDYFAGVNSIVMSRSRLILRPAAPCTIAFASSWVFAACRRGSSVSSFST